MGLIFANPAGLWGLLAIPAILAIHFLQREARRETISTLFLVEQISPLSAQGRRIERLRHSVPLWMQLATALLLTWLVAQPCRLSPDSTQNIVVVVDSSVSMSAFREAMLETVKARLAEMARAAARTEWVLIETDVTRGTLYSGGDAPALLAALGQWKPHLGTHDPGPALRLGQSLTRGAGEVIFVTDRHHDVPDGVEVAAVGKPFDNCGFAGLRIDAAEGGPVWHVLARNYGTAGQTRNWWTEVDGRKSEVRKISLGPGGIEELSGPFPPGTDRFALAMDADLFSLDDRMPIIRPLPKPLRIGFDPAGELAPFFRHFAETFENAASVPDNGDAALVTYDPMKARFPPGPAIVFLSEPEESPKYITGPVVAEPDSLTADLNWQGLLCKETLGVPGKEGDRVLLWAGDRRLVFLRQTESGPLLVVAFDVRKSNADRLPAFVLLLHRFVESILNKKAAPESRNFETNQIVEAASRPGAGPLVLSPSDADDASGIPRTPVEPGFFELRQGKTLLVNGAAYFADARQADFREAAAFDTGAGARAKLLAGRTRGDSLAPLWAVMALGLMLGNWSWLGRER